MDNAEQKGGFSYQINVENGIVAERLWGAVTAEMFQNMIRQMFQDRNFEHVRSFLCDYRDVSEFNWSEEEREAIHDNVIQLETYVPGVKIAFLLPSNPSIEAALERFSTQLEDSELNCSTFDNPESATDWLLEGKN